MTAQELPAPSASRLRRPSWKDPRLAIGLVVVLASTVAGGRIVAAADQTTAFYTARHTLTPGDPVSPDDLAVVRARLETDASYLDADHPLPADLISLRTINPGELMPLDAVGSSSALAVQPVGIVVHGDLPSTVRKGSRVDVWAVAPRSPGEASSVGTPQQLVRGAEVSEVQESGGGLGASGAHTVHVLLTDDDLPQVLTALADDSALSILPAGGAG